MKQLICFLGVIVLCATISAGGLARKRHRTCKLGYSRIICGLHRRIQIRWEWEGGWRFRFFTG